MSTSIYESEEAHNEFIRSYLWWASRRCPNQQYKELECGYPAPVFTEQSVSSDSYEKIKSECDSFWMEARDVVRRAKGRCNWASYVDTDENHIGDAGANFFHIRNEQEDFNMRSWPEPERSEFISIASKFHPMRLEVVDGKLEYRNGLPSKQPSNKPLDSQGEDGTIG